MLKIIANQEDPDFFVFHSKWKYFGSSKFSEKPIRHISYNTIDFIYDLKHEIERIVHLSLVSIKLTDKELSRILGYSDQYITQNIKLKINNDPSFQISKKIIKKWKKTLEQRFGILSQNIFYLIETYSYKNSLDLFNTLTTPRKQLKFIEQLKRKITKIITFREASIEITNYSLSRLIGKYNAYITDRIYDIHNNPHYLFSENVLQEFENNLIRKLQDLDLTTIIDIFSRYREFNDLPKSNQGILRHQSEFNEDYFKNINSVLKGYWLGLIFADGYMTLDKNSNQVIFGIEMSNDAQDLILKFAKDIGFDIHKINKITHFRIVSIIDSNFNYDEHFEFKDTIRIQFKSKKFVQHLKNLGFIVGKNKSSNIRLPELKASLNIYLGFLLGYWDGDGSKGKTLITSGSKKFLEDIKGKFDIKYEIRQKETIRKDGSKGLAFMLSLGENLMKEVFKNCINSVPPFNKRNSLKRSRI